MSFVIDPRSVQFMFGEPASMNEANLYLSIILKSCRRNVIAKFRSLKTLNYEIIYLLWNQL